MRLLTLALLLSLGLLLVGCETASDEEMPETTNPPMAETQPTPIQEPPMAKIGGSCIGVGVKVCSWSINAEREGIFLVPPLS